MKSYFQRIGRSLMLPVAVLPAAAVLMGLGYWIDPQGWGGESPIAAFLIKSGESLIGNMAILFAVGVALGMAKDRNGAAALSGLVSFLVLTTVLSSETVAMLQGIQVEQVDAAFGAINNQFIGILSGLIAAGLYNRFSETRLPQALAFFSGRRLPPILSAVTMLFVSLLLLVVWPPAYNALVAFGTGISSLGAVGAGLYGFFNRLLIPVGLHHALNAVFWFDVAGINDIQNFWQGTGQLGVTGMYQAGFFPVMMFGLPAGALAIYQMADPVKKKVTGSLMIAAAFASFFTGVTEPLEFAFMFVAPALYLIHALLTGISLFIAATFGWTAGFGFSAGLIDFLLSLKVPLANKPYMLIVQGLIFALIYYVGFRWAIKTFNLATPGRGDELESLEADEPELAFAGDGTAVAGTAETGTSRSADKRSDLVRKAEIILAGLGGKENIRYIEPCATRLRVEVNSMEKVDERRIKSAGIPGTNKTGPETIQVVVGTEVELVGNEIDKLMK